MLGLKLPTDPRWADIAKRNLEEVLTDHAWCEQKAASNAITLVVNNPDKTDMVAAMIDLAAEELSHFKMVHEKLLERGWILGPERKDEYVNDLFKFIRRGGSREQSLVDRLLFGAMIEARSCERFKILSETVDDADLRVFYRDLMISEATHYTTFIGFARQYADKDLVNKRWDEFLEYEAELLKSYGKKDSMHG